VRSIHALRLARFFGALAVKERLRPDLHVRPLVAELFLTDNCNLRCVSCACWRANTTDELTTEEWKDVLRQLRDLRILKVNVTGGEALIRRDAIELLRYASAIRIPQLHLNTNGILLTPGKRREILDAGVRSFNISIDGRGAQHDAIRGRRGAFDRTMSHLEGLLGDRSRYGLKIRMSFTVMRDTLDGLLDVVALAQERRVNLYLNLASDETFLFRDEAVHEQTQVDPARLAAVLAQLEARARADSSYLPRFSDLRYIPGHFSDIVQRDLPCAESQLKLMVRSRGEVGGCWGHDAGASVRESSIREIVDSPGYREEHARFFAKQCVGCGSNYSLNLRWRPRTYVEDTLWRLHRRSLGQLDAR
jgi:MoaA/NifB/PqqE/SkfB family radical SAM enzyme